MPTYEYECPACGGRFERFVKSAKAAPARPDCPDCGKPAERRYSVFGVGGSAEPAGKGKPAG